LTVDARRKAAFCSTGASLKELMARLGRSSMRTALVYQHATGDRDEAIAKALGGLMHRVRSKPPDQADEGTWESGLWPTCGPPARTARRGKAC
jgi:hypothetical protein